MIPVYWDNGWNGDKGFGLFNRTTLEVTQPVIVEAIVNAVAEKKPMDVGETNVVVKKVGSND
jgi:endoglucanase